MPRKKLPIEYNLTTQIGVLSEDPMTFFSIGQLFDDFLIVTDKKQRWLDDLGFENKHLNTGLKSRDGISKLFQSKKFIDLVRSNSKRKFVTYAPLDPPYKVNPLTYLMNSPTIAHAYENKRYFRDEFADLIRMPEYQNRYINELDRAAAYNDIKEEFGDFVLQDEESSGSKGTYLVRNHDDYVEAIKSLKRFSRGRSVVVSQFVEGETSSIQVCISKYGIFSGGVQKQLIDSKHLCNPKLPGASKWCGGELGSEYPDIVQHQANEIASVVGSELASHGYKGIFGIDLIITPDNGVYAIEINARLTGYTFTISDMQLQAGKIPFLLLHILELGNFKYEVTDLDALPSAARYKKPVSYLIISNPLDGDMILKQYIEPGVYKLEGDKLVFVQKGHSISKLKGEDTMLISCRYDKGDAIESGKRILKITKLGRTMNKGDLNAKHEKIIKIVKKQFYLPEG